MRILINALSARLGGGQTYLANLLSVPPGGKEVEIFLLAPGSLEVPGNSESLTRIPASPFVENPVTRAVWERIFLSRLVRRLQADVLFCPGGMIGARVPRGCKTVTMFRNMMPFDRRQRRRYPWGYMRARNWILRRLMLQSLARADGVIFLSQFGRQVIERYLPSLGERAAVIPHGVHPAFRAPSNARPRWLPAGEYLLYVSILDVYKAQLEVVRAFGIFRKERHTREKLVLAGPARSDYARRVRREIARLGLENDVLLVGDVPHQDLPALYQHASVNLFASECENCPNILIEMLAAGRPLLCSNCPPMPEIAADAAVYFDPHDPEDLAAKLLDLIDSPLRLRELSDQVRKRSERFDWAASARATWDWICKTAGQPALEFQPPEELAPLQEQIR